MDDWKEDEMDSSEFIPEEKEFSIPLPSPKWTKKETPKNNVSEFNKLIIEKKEHKQRIIKKITLNFKI